MIPFDGDFAQNYVYPLALGAYDATNAPPGFTTGRDAFEILVDTAHPEFQALLALANPKHKKRGAGGSDGVKRRLPPNKRRATWAAFLANSPRGESSDDAVVASLWSAWPPY